MNYTADWTRLARIGYYKRINDEDITRSVESKDFVDTMTDWEFADDQEAHCRRIASLVNLISQGRSLDPVELTFYKGSVEDGNWFTMDGHHRIRAYIYLRKNMPCVMHKQ